MSNVAIQMIIYCVILIALAIPLKAQVSDE